jgi:hypothetical protein
MTQGTYKADWQDCLCDDLRPVMQYLQESHRITGWRADADIQQRWSRIYLSRNPSRKLFLKVKEGFANSPQVLLLDMEIRCMTHQVRLLPRRQWAMDHGINRQPLVSFLVEMVMSFWFTVGGFFLIFIGSNEGSVREIFIGLGSILLFGLSFGVSVRDLVRHIRKK